VHRLNPRLAHEEALDRHRPVSPVLLRRRRALKIDAVDLVGQKNAVGAIENASLLHTENAALEGLRCARLALPRRRGARKGGDGARRAKGPGVVRLVDGGPGSLCR
jgi:hypothetical protein